MKKITLKIEGMHCTSCAMNIDGDLEDNVNGVTSANTNYVKQETVVEFDESITNIDQIIKQVSETGYTAQQII